MHYTIAPHLLSDVGAAIHPHPPRLYTPLPPVYMLSTVFVLWCQTSLRTAGSAVLAALPLLLVRLLTGRAWEPEKSMGYALFSANISA